MRAIPERLRGVFTARRYTNQRLPYLTLHYLTLPYLTLPTPYITLIKIALTNSMHWSFLEWQGIFTYVKQFGISRPTHGVGPAHCTVLT